MGFSLVGALLDYSDVIVSEGQLVMATFTIAGFVASLVMQHRKDARFPVLMHAVYAYSNATAGEGVAENLSVSGCKLRSTCLIRSRITTGTLSGKRSASHRD